MRRSRIVLDMTIVILTNDVLDGEAFPLSITAMRCLGLYDGLRTYFDDVRIVTTSESWIAATRTGHRYLTPRFLEGISVVEMQSIPSFLRDVGPNIVVANSLTQRKIRKVVGRDCLIVSDFVADIRLERGHVSGRQIAAWTEQYKRAVQESDVVLINGQKKAAIIYELADQTGALIPGGVHNVPFAMPYFGEPSYPYGRLGKERATLRVFVGGRLQSWQRVGVWPRALTRLLESDLGERVEIVLAFPSAPTHPDASHLESLAAGVNVTRIRGKLTYNDFAAIMASCDIFVDVQAPSPERQFAMSTRSVNALCLGLPVVHQYGTELAPIIEREALGWLVEGNDEGELYSLLRTLVSDPTSVLKTRRCVKEYYEQHLKPSRNIRVVADIMRHHLERNDKVHVQSNRGIAQTSPSSK